MKKVGTVSVDGTKIHANASKHSAVSHWHAIKMLDQLEYEVGVLMQKAEEADTMAEEDCKVKLPVAKNAVRASRKRLSIQCSF